MSTLAGDVHTAGPDDQCANPNCSRCWGPNLLARTPADDAGAAHDLHMAFATTDAVEKDSTCPPSSSDANATTASGAATSSLSTDSAASEPRSTSDSHPDHTSASGGPDTDHSEDSISGSAADTSGLQSRPSFTGGAATSSSPAAAFDEGVTALVIESRARGDELASEVYDTASEVLNPYRADPMSLADVREPVTDDQIAQALRQGDLSWLSEDAQEQVRLVQAMDALRRENDRLRFALTERDVNKPGRVR